MKPKLLLLLATCALGLFAVWYGLKGGGQDIGSSIPQGADGAPEAGTAALTEDPNGAGLVELEAPEDLGGESRNAADDAGPEGDEEADGPLAVWDEADTRWLDANLVAPRGTPSDEVAYVVAFSTPMGLAKAFASDGPFAALRDGREARRSKGVIAAAPFDSDGFARLALPPETTEAWILVGGSYLYSVEPQHLNGVGATNSITLRPSLGAYLSGKVLSPLAQTPLEGVTVAADWSINASLQLGSADVDELEREDTTGEDGQFHFYAVPVGRPIAVQTRSDLFARSFSGDLEPAAGEHRRLTITLERGGTVTGRVVNSDGEPQAGASVVALGAEFFGNPTEDLREIDGSDDGTFELTGLTPGRVWVRAKHDDFQEAMGAPFDLADGEVLQIPDIVLDRGQSISGTIAFPDGRPAVGAEVKVKPDLSENVGGSPVDPKNFAGADNDATTGESGDFEIWGLGEGPWTLTVELTVEDEARPEENGRWSASKALIRAPAKELALVLEPPVTFIGSVATSAGDPVLAFTVEGKRSGSQWYMPPSETSSESFESEDGTFALADLRSGDWTFTVRAEGMAPAKKMTVKLPTEEASAFVLFEPIRLTGKVLDPTGRPVAGAQVAKELEGQETFQAMAGRGDWATAKSDETGLFALEGMAPGAGSIIANKDGWARSDGYAYDLAEGESENDIVLVLRSGGTISGEIFGADGEPAAGCVIILQMPTLEDRRFTNADSDGRFEEKGLTPGTWQVQAFPGMSSLQPENGEALNQATLLKALKMTSVELKDEASEHVVLGSPPKAPVRVHGTVSVAGNGVPDLVVSFVNAEGAGLDALKIATTDKEGAYELVLDEPGEYLMTVQSPGVAGMQNSVEFRRRIPETEDHELDVNMPMGRITGRVVGPDGDAQKDARVTLSMQSGHMFGTMMGGQYNETRTDENGQYEILYVRAGDYAVAAGGSYLGGLLGGEGGLGRQVKSIKVEDDAAETVNFQLESPGELHGVVRDSGGKPVTDASIFLRNEKGQLLELFSFQATNASGSFDYDGLAPGEYTITARAEGMASSMGTAVRIRSGEITETTVTVDAGTVLFVSLTDKTGADIRSRISVLDEAGHEVNGMLSVAELMSRISGGIDGKEQRVGPLPPGNYEVRAFAEDGRSVTRRARLTGKAEKKMKLRLK